ncbi:MAG: ATP-binding protein, partial [Nonomuraea sp.]|nr:ATP-binding protein [Nonomuraea sp.]
TIPDATTARTLVATRFEVQYGEAGIKPPYPTWPVRPEAFEQAPGFTPRQLLIRIDRHIHACLLDGEVRELAGFAAEPPPVQETRTAQPPVDLGELDARYAELLESVRPPVVDQANEDAVIPPLLAAGLFAWIAEQGEPGLAFKVDPPPSAKPPLHARLRRTLDETREDEVHWAFRAVGAGHGNAALNRVRKACVAAGLDADVPKRRLFLLRNTPWSTGAATQEAIGAFERAGGRTLRYSQNDVRILAALRELVAASPPDLAAWLAARRPTTTIGFLTEALANAWTVPPIPAVPGDSPSAAPDAPRQVPAGSPQSPSAGLAREPYVAVGRRIADGEPVTVALEALRKHTAIFAGSGSGKTVLIRRLVEECALRGVSSIVLDPNNDLARLGEPWPDRPPGWEDGDDRRAREYLEGTEVTIWTPGRTGGRPLAFQPLPDLASLAGDPDEFAEAVEAAVAFIVPRLRLEARTAKADRGQAVLRKALAAYGRSGATSLRGLAAYLSDLPDGVSELAGAPRIAADLAQSLTAAMDNDPLFGGTGEPVDPALLVTPPPGKRARVSVISLAGLPSQEQRQSFVSRLEMELFVWFKRHPAQDRPLGALFVMDEAQTFAPAAGGASVSTRSTVMLASQARKYGLGLVFATQAPKGLHNQIPGNCATQFFGLLNVPVQIGAAKEMARAKGGGDVPDISRLGPGEFYVAREGATFTKARMPMCLTHHPKAPLTTEEVIARSRARDDDTTPHC